MNNGNGNHRNSLPPARTGGNGNGNGTATAVRRNGNSTARAGGNGTRPRTSSPSPAERDPAPASVEALHWDALAPRVTEALAQPLDPQLVSQRKGRGGRKFDYIEGHTAIDQANRIFGFGGWGYELVGDVTLSPIEQTDQRTGEVTRTTAYAAVVRVTVPGAPSRTDVGFQPVAEESPEGHETAFKGAVTDALKRALRSFGDRFGNGLYGDPPTDTRGTRDSQPAPRQQQSAPEGESQPRAQRRVVQPASQQESDDARDARNLQEQLVELSLQQGFTDEQVRVAVRNKTGRELDELGPAELNPLIASAADKLAQAQQSAAG